MSTNEPDLAPIGARIRNWGRRPPVTAGSTAARQVMARLEGRAARAPWVQRLAYAAAAAAAVLVAWIVLGPAPRVETPPAATSVPAMRPEVPSLPSNVVQFWLDAETPVYFVTGPLEPIERGSP
jgi:hypothetical protein